MQPNFLIAVIAFSFLGSIAGLIGSVVFFVNKKLSNFLIEYSTAFAAGILLSVVFFHLLPETHELIGNISFTIIFVTFILSFLFEHMLFYLHHHSHEKHAHGSASVPLVLIGDSIHNFIDGVAIAAASFQDLSLGFIIALSTFLHETPHEIGDFGVLLSRGFSKKKALIANLISASFTFVGALFVILFATDSPQIVGILLSASAGLFLYLGASDFLPDPGTDGKKDNFNKLCSFLLGVAIMWLMTVAIPE